MLWSQRGWSQIPVILMRCKSRELAKNLALLSLGDSDIAIIKRW